MVIPTGINVNKNKRVEKMTKEEVKALIQTEKQKEETFRVNNYKEYVGSEKDLAEQKRLNGNK